jgi:hypothetical protein
MTDWNNYDECMVAVQQDGYSLRNVINQTDEICKLAVHLLKKL